MRKQEKVANVGSILIILLIFKWAAILKNTSFRFARSSYINRQFPNGNATQVANKDAPYLFKMLTLLQLHIRSHDSKHNVAIPHVIKHKYIGAKWSAVCTNVLVHYLMGSSMFFITMSIFQDIAHKFSWREWKRNIFPK